MDRNDPLRNYRFTIEFEGSKKAGFSDVIVAETTVDMVDYRNDSDPTHARKLSGLTKYGNITLKRGMTTGKDGQVLASVVTNPQGDVNQLVFSEAKVDQGLPDALFHFEPPKGAFVQEF